VSVVACSAMKRSKTSEKIKLYERLPPSRRSGRKCSKVLEKEKLESYKEKVRLKIEAPGLKIVEVEKKGRGVNTSYMIPRGVYVCEYQGELLTKKEGMIREKTKHECDPRIGCCMYYFCYGGQKYCVDATE